MLIQSCLGTRYLQEGEQLLVKQAIKGNKKVKKKDLTKYYQQKRNNRLLFLPFTLRVWTYQVGKRHFDTIEVKNQITRIEKKIMKKIEEANGNERKVNRLKRKKNRKIDKKTYTLKEGNLLMRWGEPLAIYDDDKRKETEKNFLSYLKSKGYFEANVQSKVKSNNKKVKVSYFIEENAPYIISLTRLNTLDTAISKIIQARLKQSLIKKGDNYDQDSLIKERERIDELLKDYGYYNFSQQYVSFNVDTTTLGNRKVGIETVISLPRGGNAHKVFTIDSVVFVADGDQAEQASKGTSISYGGITFNFLCEKLPHKILARRIFLKPNQFYRKKDVIETQRQLTNLAMFQHTSILSDTTGNKLTMRIYTNLLKKYQASNEIGLQVSQGIPGPFYNLSLKSRNILDRLETLALDTKVALEDIGVSPEKKTAIYENKKFSTDLSLIFPQFLLPFSNALPAKIGKANPATKFLLGYAFQRRPAYRRRTVKGMISYLWQRRGSAFYEFALTNINLINSTIDNAFQEVLNNLKNQGNNLYRTFKTSLVSSLFLKAIFKKNLSSDRRYSYLELFFESGGTTQTFFNLPKIIDDSLEYYQYLKFSLDYSRHVPVHQNAALAYRINFGIANPYGKSQVLPYEKYYFAGGSSSIRAWLPRRLGPGSYKHNPDEEPDIERQGEILLQGSIELRQKLIGFLEGALFVDVGNVWMIHGDHREGGEFRFNRFYKELAAGTGLGLRLNFKLIIIRFDTGIKLYDPAQQRFVIDKITLRRPLGESGQVVFNLGIGYPF
ncbi:MAG: outer membrane protein assembly factor [Cytophagales bacterium]|nr:outer membrane protein assembly factor [Cytophagales bacterium]